MEPQIETTARPAASNGDCPYGLLYTWSRDGLAKRNKKLFFPGALVQLAAGERHTSYDFARALSR